MSEHQHQGVSRTKFAWLRLNAYGILLSGLMIFPLLYLTNPEQSSVARLIGRVPALQPVWSIGYGLAGLFLIIGFIRARSTPELVGLGLLSVSISVQTLVIAEALGPWVGESIRGYLVWAIVVGCAALRASALLTRDGLTITISGRKRPDKKRS